VPDIPPWPEIESQVPRPGRWLALAVGTLFLLAGAIAFWIVTRFIPAGTPLRIAELAAFIAILLGAAVFFWAIANIVAPAHVRHAPPDLLPNVPREPVILEGSVLHFRLTHELHEDTQGWHFRPASRLWRHDQVFLLGFGLPFAALFTGLTAWALYSQLHVASWPVAALCGAMATGICVGSVWLSLAVIMRASYRRLPRLSIPRNGETLELDAPQELSAKTTDLAAGLKWLFLGETKRYRLTIPRQSLVAVQLCPWKYKVAMPRTKTTWAVQGLLVLASPDEAACPRLPILLTGDLVGAARLMQQLAHILHVPYLFSADAAGWKAEAQRAQQRPPQKVGGMQT
jgi:hypothetical protein